MGVDWSSYIVYNSNPRRPPWRDPNLINYNNERGSLISFKEVQAADIHDLGRMFDAILYNMKVPYAEGGELYNLVLMMRGDHKNRPSASSVLDKLLAFNDKLKKQKSPKKGVRRARSSSIIKDGMTMFNPTFVFPQSSVTPRGRKAKGVKKSKGSSSSKKSAIAYRTRARTGQLRSSQLMQLD
jgi:hypothetical protein